MATITQTQMSSSTPLSPTLSMVEGVSELCILSQTSEGNRSSPSLSPLKRRRQENIDEDKENASQRIAKATEADEEEETSRQVLTEVSNITSTPVKKQKQSKREGGDDGVEEEEESELSVTNGLSTPKSENRAWLDMMLALLERSQRRRAGLSPVEDGEERKRSLVMSTTAKRKCFETPSGSLSSSSTEIKKVKLFTWPTMRDRSGLSRSATHPQAAGHSALSPSGTIGFSLTPPTPLSSSKVSPSLSLQSGEKRRVVDAAGRHLLLPGNANELMKTPGWKKEAGKSEGGSPHSSSGSPAGSSSSAAIMIGPDNSFDPEKEAKKVMEETKPTSAGCKCKSGCLKLYCRCFASKSTCGEICGCTTCQNRAESTTRLPAIVDHLQRNPKAFASTVEDVKAYFIPLLPQAESILKTHRHGCRCVKSGCLKKYCECFQANIACGERCRCKDCKNTFSAQQANVKPGITTKHDNVEVTVIASPRINNARTSIKIVL